jgi:hypothetical protein
MPISSPLLPLDADAARLFRAEMPEGVIPVEALGLAEGIAGALFDKERP